MFLQVVWSYIVVMEFFTKPQSNPYRIMFPLATILGLWGILLWLPLVFVQGEYPVLVHRYLMLNGFTGLFIAGFLMTAVPRFSQTKFAQNFEILSFVIVTLAGLVCAYLEYEKLVFIFSSLQATLILMFLFVRILKRKANPPYSFIFIFVGLLMWGVSGLLSAFFDVEAFKVLHYEGSVAAIILGVGSRLIPGILGHVEIVQTQRNRYENERPFILTVPLHFFAIMAAFIGSYFLQESIGIFIRAFVVLGVGLFYWKLFSLPKTKSALTRCLWFSCWLIILSFFLKALWFSGAIHVSHAFFINGILLLTLLVATRVLQSHGPKDMSLENSNVLYVLAGLVFLSSIIRVCAFMAQEDYFRLLGVSSLILAGSILIWSWKYLRFVKN